MSITLALLAKMTVRETLSGNAIASNASPLVFDGFNLQKDLTAATTPPVTKHCEFTQALTAGAATIDLTALSGSLGSVTFSGLKLQAYLFTNLGANVMTISKGASNGYGLDAAAADYDIVVAPGATVMGYIPDVAPDVSGSAKNIDIAGTGTQSLEVVLVAG